MGVTLAVGLATAAAGAGATMYASNKSAKAAKAAAEQQNKLAGQQFDMQKEYMAFLEGQAGEYAEMAEHILGENKDIVEDSYGRILGIINAIPRVDQLWDRAQGLSRKDFDYRTGIKRENLDFILGDTDERLREIQSFSADLANLEEGAFTGKFDKIIRSNMLGLKALTVGEPSGSFANLSARNLYDFSNKALSNYLSINDFFAKEGTVDPISPYTISQDLFANEFNIAGQRIGNERWRGEQLVNVNNAALGVEGNKFAQSSQIAQLGMGATKDYFSTLMGNAGIEQAADAQRAQGVAQGIGLFAQGMGSTYGLIQQQQALGTQKSYYDALIQNMNAQSLNSYAPRYTSPTSSVAVRPISSNFSEPALPQSYSGGSIGESFNALAGLNATPNPVTFSVLSGIGY